MNATSSDTELLRAFAHGGDQEAFRAIVERHIQSVYAAARRQIRDAQLAEDVAQATFVMLARKADSIRDGAILGGWLVTTARLAAKTALRGEMRRQRREQRAATMSLQQNQQPSGGGRRGGGGGKRSDANDPSVAVEHADTLERVDAAIDDALSRLSPADRAAVTLRYLESRPIREVAQIMGTSEHAAAKRVTRAVARLRENFRRRRIDLTPAALIGMLERQAIVHVPAELSKNALAAATGASSSHAAIAIANAALARASLRAAVIAATFAVIVAQRGAARRRPNRQLQLRHRPHAAGAGSGHRRQIHRERFEMGGGPKARMKGGPSG